VALSAQALALVGCASTQLEVAANDSANPAATTQPLPPVGRALDGDFEPQNPGAPPPGADSVREEGHDHEEEHEQGTPHSNHQHGAHGQEGNGPEAAMRTARDGEPQGANGNDSKDAPKQWTCTMHPEIIKSEPGKCPICGMQLVPVSAKKPSGATP
jgi:hypothetical protein